MTDYLGGSKLRLEGISHPRESLVAQTEDTRNPHCPIRRKSFLNDRQLYEHLSIYHPDIFECPKPNVITREIQHFLMKDNEASVSCSDNEYYPESFALEEEEQPLLGVYDESGPSDFFSQISGLETFSWVLKRLHQKNVSPEEVMLLWYHFLTEKQRAFKTTSVLLSGAANRDEHIALLHCARKGQGPGFTNGIKLWFCRI